MIEPLFLPALLPTLLTAATPQPDSTAQAPPAAPASLPEFSAEDTARLRCAAAFSIVAVRDGGSELSARGREFFVVTLAGLMDAYTLDREAITRAVRIEAEAIAKAGEVDAMMPACLLMLQAEGL